MDFHTLFAYVRGFPFVTNEVLANLKLPYFETVLNLKKPFTAFGRCLIVCPDQKHVAIVRHICRILTKGPDMVPELCIGTVATAKPCLLDAKHQKFIGCNSDSKCIERIMLFILETLARQVLSGKIDITEKEEIQVAAIAYLKMLSSGRSARPRNT